MRDSRVDERPLVHYAGMMFCSRPEARLVNEVRDALVAGNVVAVYGSLASGSDVVIAEVVLSLSIELHAVVPCSLHQFRQASVGLGGARWLERFDEDVEIAVLAAASESHPGEAGRADWSGLPDDGLRLGSSFHGAQCDPGRNEPRGASEPDPEACADTSCLGVAVGIAPTSPLANVGRPVSLPDGCDSVRRRQSGRTRCRSPRLRC